MGILAELFEKAGSNMSVFFEELEKKEAENKFEVGEHYHCDKDYEVLCVGRNGDGFVDLKINGIVYNNLSVRKILGIQGVSESAYLVIDNERVSCYAGV